MGECSAAQPQAVFVTERAAENHQQINEPSDAEHPTGQQPQNACAHLAHIEPVDAHAAEHQTQEKRQPAALFGGHAIDPGNRIRLVGVDRCSKYRYFSDLLARSAHASPGRQCRQLKDSISKRQKIRHKFSHNVN